jgi:hypothetical protein
MFAVSAILGAKYYPIPYRWGRLAGLLLMMGAVYGVSMLVDNAFFASVTISDGISGQLLAKLGVHTLLVLVYAAAAYLLIRKR